MEKNAKARYDAASMRKIGKRARASKKIAAPTISAIVFAAICLLGLFGAFDYLENRSYDLRVRFFAPRLRPSDEIVLVLVDQRSIDWAQRERGWGWPWPRAAYAEMLGHMRGAASVTFDIIFSEPSMHGPEDDEAFARAAAEHGGAVQGVFFSSQAGSGYRWPQGLDAPLFRPQGFGDFLGRFGEGAAGAPLVGAQFPIEALRGSAAGLGSLTGIPDSDGVIRRLRLFTYFDGAAVPGLAAAALMVSGQGGEADFDRRRGIARWGAFEIPVGRDGSSLLRFRGDPGRYFPYSASDILASREAHLRGEAPPVPPEDFDGAHVFVGLFAPGLFDIFATPISPVYMGMGVHVTMLDNILSGDFARESRPWANMLILLAAICATVLLCMASQRALPAALGAALALALVVAWAFAAYYRLLLWVPMVAPLAGIAAAFTGATLYNYATEGSQKRFIKTAFSQYLSPKVIERIIADPSQLRLGGEKREMTAMFTDVRAFSTISEALGDPQKLVELLNLYLTRMSDIILENQGTIDKFEGDAIIAFFGAPVHFDSHATLACRAAALMKEAEAEINREALALGLVTRGALEALAGKGALPRCAGGPRPLFTRIGINSGEMVVGNMGTPAKMNYTIMGNSVNLAARLEGANKAYDTGGILISEYTRAQIGDGFALRPLSRARVVGISAPLRIYELLGMGAARRPESEEAWERGLGLYERMDFGAAAALFSEIAGRDPSDLVAKKYLLRCRAHLASPPDEKAWDGGIDNLTEK